MKFALGEKVGVRNKSSLGEVTMIKQETSVLFTHTTVNTKYLVKFNKNESNWYEEELLKRSDEFDDKILIRINKLLIDAHLKEGKLENYEMVKKLNDEINELDK